MASVSLKSPHFPISLIPEKPKLLPPYSITLNSVRLLLARPSGVELSEIGLESANPRHFSREGETPFERR